MKEFKNGKTIKTNYYAVSTDNGLGKYEFKKIKDSDIDKIMREGKCKFLFTYDGCDHPTYFPCKIVKEIVVTYKTYKDI